MQKKIKKNPSLIVALMPVCFSILGLLVGFLIEEVIIGTPQFQRTPIAGALGWLLICVLGFYVGVCVIKKYKHSGWLKLLGILGIVANLISLLFLATIYPSTIIINTKVIKIGRDIVPIDRLEEYWGERRRQTHIANDKAQNHNQDEGEKTSEM